MRLVLLPLLLLFFISNHAQVHKVNAETTIQNVTVFSSGAQIQRTANIPITAGRSQIIFSGLSNQLEQQSLQLKADANITLLSVQTTKDYTGVRKIDQEERMLLEKNSQLKDKIDMDNKLFEVYKNEESMLVKNQSIGGQTGVKSVDLKEALDLQRQRLTEVYQKQLEIQKRVQLQQQELEKARTQLTEISKKRDSVSYAVTALIDSKQTQNVNFQLAYNVKDAGWYPTYDVRVTDITQPMNMVLSANVFQRSGETWDNVVLQLSTGNPTDNATPSPLQPWIIDFYDPSVTWMHAAATQRGIVTGRIITEDGAPLTGASITVKGSKLGTVTDANGYFKLENFPQGSTANISSVGYESKEISLKPGYYTIQLKAAANALQEVVVTGYSSLQGEASGIINNNSDKKKREEIQTVSVATQYQPTTTVYTIEDKYTLETDGKTTTIAIKNFSIPAQYTYFTAPKLDASVFLTAKIINWQDYDLHSGEANLYYEGTFLGKTYIDLDTAPDTLSISLGKDNAIKVSRKLVKELSSKKFIGSNRTESKQYELSVRNTKKIPVNITVLDQFPVSTNKEIDVENTEAPLAQIDKTSGLVTWNLQLPTAQERKLQISYSVKYPKDRKVMVD